MKEQLLMALLINLSYFYYFDTQTFLYNLLTYSLLSSNYNSAKRQEIDGSLKVKVNRRFKDLIALKLEIIEHPFF